MKKYDKGNGRMSENCQKNTKGVEDKYPRHQHQGSYLRTEPQEERVFTPLRENNGNVDKYGCSYDRGVKGSAGVYQQR